MPAFLLFLTACLLAGASALVGSECLLNDACDDGECCAIPNQFLVVSRRIVAQSILPISGKCEKYKLEGEFCSLMEKLNGHCACAAGLGCRSYEVPIPNATASPNTAEKRGYPLAKEGYYWVSKCEKVEE